MMFIWLMQGLFALIVIYYAFYVLIELRLILLTKKLERTRLVEIGLSGGKATSLDEPPKVSVLLPVYNESTVIKRLVDAVCAFEYPNERLEILILDDSTDQTTQIASQLVCHHSALGTNIKLIRREDRSGYKAGNLANGFKLAHGEFLAIFDADFIPPVDFLLKTIPCFDDRKVGYLQTGIGFTNRDASFLTRFQAMEMGHQQFVTVGLNNEGLLGSLSGSSCVWRRECVESIGGWSAATITEDVDLGYRAQLDQWQYVFLRDVVSLSDLPEFISTFRIQRDRWARGLIHNAFRYLPLLIKSPMSPIQRLHAVSVMCSSLLLASFFVLILLSLPLALAADNLGVFFNVNAALFLILVIIWAFSNSAGSQHGARHSVEEPLWQRLSMLFGYVMMFLPMSLYYFSAGLQLMLGKTGKFNRTPKGAGIPDNEMPRINLVLAVSEFVVFIYSAVVIIISLNQENYWLVLFGLAVFSGFSLALYFSWIERVAKREYTNRI